MLRLESKVEFPYPFQHADDLNGAMQLDGSVINCTFWLPLYSIRFFPMHSLSVMHHSFSLFPNTFSLLLSVNFAHASLWALAVSEIPWLRSQNPDRDYEYCGGVLSAIVV